MTPEFYLKTFLFKFYPPIYFTSHRKNTVNLARVFIFLATRKRKKSFINASPLQSVRLSLLINSYKLFTHFSWTVLFPSIDLLFSTANVFNEYCNYCYRNYAVMNTQGSLSLHCLRRDYKSHKQPSLFTTHADVDKKIKSTKFNSWQTLTRFLIHIQFLQIYK